MKHPQSDVPRCRTAAGSSSRSPVQQGGTRCLRGPSNTAHPMLWHSRTQQHVPTAAPRSPHCWQPRGHGLMQVRRARPSLGSLLPRRVTKGHPEGEAG